MSPARMGGNLPHHQRSQQPPPQLQGADFPPLSSAPEKKTPVVGGAWTNTSSMRSVLRAGPPASANVPAAGSALVHYPNTAGANGGNGRGPSPNGGRLDEQDRSFERPPPKDNAALFNPKGTRSPILNGAAEGEDKENGPESLVERVEGLTLAANGEGEVLSASPIPASPPAEA